MANNLRLTKLTFECVDTQTGQVYNRVLEGKNVDQWVEWMQFVCVFADEYGVNPKWHDLEWSQTEVKTKTKRKKELPQNDESSKKEQ